MEDTNSIAATPTEASVTASAPVETSTENISVESSEKTQTTQEIEQDSTVGSDRDANGQLIPKARLDEVISERNELRKKMEEIERQKSESERLSTMTPEQQYQEEQLEVAKQTLQKLGFVTKEEQEKMAQEQKAANMFIAECNRLEGKHDGSDGMPKFVATEVAEYMDELAKSGQYISDPETAYKLKYLDQIAETKAKQQRSSTFSEKQQGGMNQVNDTRSSELEAASKTGDFTQFLKKHAPMPKS